MPARLNKQKCNGCESCVDECPNNAISLVDGRAAVDADVCIDCGVCVDVCPQEAIRME